MIARAFKITVFTLFFLIIVINLKAETRRDTLINKAWRDTVRLQKAQIYSFDASHDAIYFRPKPFQFLKFVPTDLYQLGKTAVSKEALPYLGAVVLSTAALASVDQRITDAAKQFGRFINLSTSHDFKPVAVHIGGKKIRFIDLPENLNMAFYFLGEGYPSIAVAAGFYGYGLAARDYRALQTTSQLTEMFFTLAITTQLMKRLSGRQSPFRAMDPSPGEKPVPGGAWHPFVSWKKYQKNVSNYDAFPSGHLATLMATITVLSGNYPENRFIKPIGYSIMGLCGFAMLNNGVHWAGDYPMAIAIGYAAGKIAVSRGHILVPKKNMETGATSMFLPAYLGQGTLGVSYYMIF
jgi:hypothetical protein